MTLFGTRVDTFKLDENPRIEIAYAKIGTLSIRFLGPEVLWGGDTRIQNAGEDQIMKLIEETGKRTALRLVGYFVHDVDSEPHYHMSRLPRRINLEVPPISTFRQAQSEFGITLNSHAIEHQSTEETLSEVREMRILLGLQEGYFEQRRLDVLAKIADGTFDSLVLAAAAVRERIGDLSRFGINLTAMYTLEDLELALTQSSMTTTHEVDEVRDFLPSALLVTPVHIFSVAPDYTYKEPAVLIRGEPTEENFRAICEIADQLHQARFSLEFLHTGEALNVEILAHCDNAAARLG